MGRNLCRGWLIAQEAREGGFGEEVKAADGFGRMAGDADDGFLTDHSHDERLSAPHGHAVNHHAR